MLGVSEREAVRDEIKGQEKIFCCHGCSGIYRIINNEGLDDFYRKRRDWSPGPAEDKYLDVSAFLENLRPAGNEIETDLMLEGIRCASCVWLNEKVLERTSGITYARVNYATHRARIRWNPGMTEIATILNRIKSIGYLPKPFLPKAFDEEQKRQSSDLLIRFGTAAFFSMQLMLFSVALYAGYFQGIDLRTKNVFHVIALLLTTPVLFYSGWPIIKGAVQGLRHRTFNMDVLIAAGAGSAYGYSIYQMMTGGEVYFDTSAMIITFILLGRYIEAGAKRKASETISALMQLAPREARKLDRDDQEETIAVRTMTPLTTIRPGDLLEVVPGEKIPLDGIVVSGTSETDESMLTGESRPCSKTEGAQVFGGTQNLYGSLIFRVTRTGKNTVLARIIQAVEDAQSRRAPIQAFADRVVGWFVPAVLALALATLLGWMYAGAPASQAVMNAVSVLVIACPCALGLATPLAILIGTSHGASRGILIKGGDVIEKTAKIDSVVLDKTGTLTEGKPVLSGFFGVGITDQEALRLASSLERLSEHSLGKAIVAAARDSGPYEVTDFSVMPGKGIRGTVLGKPTLVGNRKFMETDGIGNAVIADLDNGQREKLAAFENTASTIIYLCHDKKLRGLFMVSDKVRTDAFQAVAMLGKAGLCVSMVTCDNAITAGAVAKTAGITAGKAQVAPVEKAGEIERMENEGRRVAMVGDGINDAPALVRATVGIAMGRATDIALESSGIVIMRPDLTLVAGAIALSKKTFLIIRQNIFFAFFYNAVVIPLAVLGILHPIMAAAAMAMSSLSVVANSLRARSR